MLDITASRWLWNGECGSAEQCLMTVPEGTGNFSAATLGSGSKLKSIYAWISSIREPIRVAHLAGSSEAFNYSWAIDYQYAGVPGERPRRTTQLVTLEILHRRLSSYWVHLHQFITSPLPSSNALTKPGGLPDGPLSTPVSG